MTGLPFGPCPDCGRELSVTARPDGSPHAVIHVMPMCPTYRDMSADAFVRFVIDVRAGMRRAPVPE